MRTPGWNRTISKAIGAYSDVLLHGDPAPEDYFTYGWLLELHARHGLEQAAAYYEKVTSAESCPETLRDKAWVQHARVLCMLGRDHEALERHRQRVQAAPESVSARLSLAQALLFAAEPQAALAEAKVAQGLAPEDPRVLCILGDILGGEQGLHEPEQALLYWSRALEIDPDFLDARYSLAYAYRELG